MTNPVSVHLVATPFASASGLFGLFDALMAAGRDWETFVTREATVPVFDVKLVAPTSETFICASGLRVTPDLSFDQAGPSDLVVVPGMTVSSQERLDASEQGSIAWLKERSQSEARIVSACTGAIYLAEIGLLDGIEATTHWAYADLFRRHFPGVRLRLDRSICFSDASRGVVTSGGTTAWQELALFLIAHYGGVHRAAKTAKFWLMADRGELQAPYSSFVKAVPHGDAIVETVQLWLADNYAIENPVGEMATRSGLPATSFARRFRNATGLSPIDYVQNVRMEEAKQFLETTDLPVADIGAEIGYNDPASFRRLFKRKTGITPIEHRRMFGAKRFAHYS